MTAINRSYAPALNGEHLDLALRSLAIRLEENRAEVIDLIALKPTPDEIESAARWAMTHDVSEGFVVVLKRLLRSIGYDTVAERL